MLKQSMGDLSPRKWFNLFRWLWPLSMKRTFLSMFFLLLPSIFRFPIVYSFSLALSWAKFLFNCYFNKNNNKLSIEISPITVFYERERKILAWVFFSLFMITMLSSLLLMVYNFLINPTEQKLWGTLTIPLFFLSFCNPFFPFNRTPIDQGGWTN